MTRKPGFDLAAELAKPGFTQPGRWLRCVLGGNVRPTGFDLAAELAKPGFTQPGRWLR